MSNIIQEIEARYKKSAVVDVKSGDTVRVHQKIREGGKERVQIFEGLVIKTSKKNSLTSNFTVRRISSGIGVEKTFPIHSPGILKIEVVKRSKVRRNYLSYMRELTGKSARLSGQSFDKEAVNAVHDEAAEAEEAKIHEEAEAQHEVEAKEKAEENAKTEEKFQEAVSAHSSDAENKKDETKTE